MKSYEQGLARGKVLKQGVDREDEEALWRHASHGTVALHADLGDQFELLRLLSERGLADRLSPMEAASKLASYSSRLLYCMGVRSSMNSFGTDE